MEDNLFGRWKQQHEKSCRRLIPAAAAMLAGFLSSALGAQPTLRKIVDSADPVPGAPQATWESFRPFFDVAVDGDEVAFIGFAGEAGEFRDGVYAYRGGSLQVVADDKTTRPGTSSPLPASGASRSTADGSLSPTRTEGRRWLEPTYMAPTACRSSPTTGPRSPARGRNDFGASATSRSMAAQCSSAPVSIDTS